MKELELVPITIDDIDAFDNSEYQGLTKEKRLELINSSLQGMVNGKFFRFYLLRQDEKIIGFMNFCEKSKSVISIAPEIKVEFRNRGYATKALTIAYSLAKAMGFKAIVGGIREDNLASQKLHEKLGFELVQKFINKNQKEMRLYIKIL